MTDERGIDVGGVSTSKNGAQRKTDRSGTAVYDDVQGGSYTIDVAALTPDLQKLFEDFAAPTTRIVTVAAGQIAYVPYQLFRKPTLSVRVRCADDGRHFRGADVRIQGPETASTPTTSTGVAGFGRVRSGDYRIKVKLPRRDEDNYATTLDFATHEGQQVILAAAQEEEAIVDVERINVVSPAITLEKKELFIDDGKGAEQARITRVELSLSQTNPAHAYDKEVAFKCESTTDVEVFTDAACSKKPGKATDQGVAITDKVDTQQDDGTMVSLYRVYLRAKKTGGPIRASFSLPDPGSRFVRVSRQPSPVDAEIHVLARPEVKIEWLTGEGLDGSGDIGDVTVDLEADGRKHVVPKSLSGIATWAVAERGIKPDAYDCRITFGNQINYLVHDANGVVVSKPSFQLKPDNPSVTFKIAKGKVTLAVECVRGKDREDVTVDVKLKSIAGVFTLKPTAPEAVVVPVIAQTQKRAIEIESVTITPKDANLTRDTDVYELVEVKAT